MGARQTLAPHIVALIPARRGSKGIPNKNIVKLGQHPLIAYSIAISAMSKYINQIVVTTDSEEITSIAKNYGAEAPFLRPLEISGDNSIDKEFFLHYLCVLQEMGQPVPELIVHLRPSSPFRELSFIDDAIKYMLENRDASALRSAHETHLTPYKIFYKENGCLKPFLDYPGEKEFYNLPRQVFRKAYIPNGVVDIVRPRILLESGLLHGERIKLWETPASPDIDVKEDLEYAERELNNQLYQPIIKYLKERRHGA